MMIEANPKIFLGLNSESKDELSNFTSGYILAFCDLSEWDLGSLDLSKSRLVGCKLTDRIIQSASFGEMQVIDCFSLIWGPYVPEQRTLTSAVVSLITDSYSERNDIRYDAVFKLGELNNPELSLFIAARLFDEEWEVRSIALKKLIHLWALNEEYGFACENELQLIAILSRLGDDHPIVRATAFEWLGGIPEKLLIKTISILNNSRSGEVTALRLVYTLISADRRKYSFLLNQLNFNELTQHNFAPIRKEAVRLLSLVDDSGMNPLIIKSLHDVDPLVRVESIIAMSYISEDIPKGEIIHLLSDPDEEVRLQALITLEDLEELTEEDLKPLLEDSSTQVSEKALRILRKLL